MPNFHDRLEVFIDRKVDARRKKQLIGPVQQRGFEAVDRRFDVRVQVITDVSRNVYVFANAGINEERSQNIAAVTARARSIEKLSDTIGSTVMEPSIGSYDTDAHRIIITCPAP